MKAPNCAPAAASLGTLPRERLDRLTRLLAERRGEIDDPRLAALIDEIELRAAVELAKLERRVSASAPAWRIFA